MTSRREFLCAASMIVVAPRFLASCGTESVPSTPDEDGGANDVDVIPLREAFSRLYGDQVGFAPGYSTSGVEGTVAYFRPGSMTAGAVTVCEEFSVNGWFTTGRVPPGFTGPVTVDTVLVRWDPVANRPLDQIELLSRCG